MKDKIKIAKQRFDEVSDLIIQPDIITDQKRYVALNKEYKDLKAIVDKGEEYLAILANIEEAKEIISDGSDAEMVEMARMELEEAGEKKPELEEELRNKSGDIQEKAIINLYKLSQMLHLPVIGKILEEAAETTEEERKIRVETFYDALGSLTTYSVPGETAVAAPAQETGTEEALSPPVPQVEEKEEKAAELPEKSICILELDHIKPIHFDFRLEEAAEDLSLPVNLIEEFVNDFIEQAHAEKQTFIDACRSGDITTIQKTGHKLKGAASNLRIKPLAETLEEIQFCEDKSRFEDLLKKYWGQFRAFELFMKSKSH